MSRIRITAVDGAVTTWPQGAGILGANKESAPLPAGQSVEWEIAAAHPIQPLVPPDEDNPFAVEAQSRARGVVADQIESAVAEARARLRGWLVEKAEALKQKLDELVAAVRNQAAADMAAPAVGSASKAFRPEPAQIDLAVLEGNALVRLYHAKNTAWTGADARDFGVEYIDLDGAATSDAWTEVLMVAGEERRIAVIESNAITVAFYA